MLSILCPLCLHRKDLSYQRSNTPWHGYLRELSAYVFKSGSPHPVYILSIGSVGVSNTNGRLAAVSAWSPTEVKLSCRPLLPVRRPNIHKMYRIVDSRARTGWRRPLARAVAREVLSIVGNSVVPAGLNLWPAKGCLLRGPPPSRKVVMWTLVCCGLTAADR